MKGFISGDGGGGASPRPEARHRPIGSLADAIKISSQKCGNLRAANKHFKHLLPQKASACKVLYWKLVLVILLFGSFFAILHSPTAYHAHSIQSGSRNRFVNIGWIWEKTSPDARYISHVDIDWAQTMKVVEKLDSSKGYLKVGLLNYNSTEIKHWKKLLPNAGIFVMHLVPVQSNLTWEVLYPEWIDEEEESEVPACPPFPEPKVPKGLHFDLIAVKLPCNKSSSWSRDVARLHLQLAAARVAAESTKGHHPVHVLFMTTCFPIPNLFTCKDLVIREGSAWLYKPELKLLKQKLQLPVGSCELALPLKANVRQTSIAPLREAYATILHSANVYVCGAIAAAQSIRMAGSKRDLVILVDETVNEHHRSGLRAAGWKIKIVERIRNPRAEPDAYNEFNYSKFRLWQLTEYDKIIFIDADLLILRNIDFLFTMPEITATGNNATLFNSGVMVIEPSNCTFQLLMDHIHEIKSYNGGDQGYLNEIFTWWHRIPKHMNFLKHFWQGDEPEIKEMKTRLYGADPPVLYVIHYLGLKPWLCFRDYDCNWNVDILQEFASDVAHETWWKVHDKMPEHLQSFCLLRSKQKASLEWDRRQAEKVNYSDGHWRRNISDPRLNICFEEFCFWESMLWHWGDPTWDGKNNNTSITLAKLPS